jgi:hypothetical protein
MTNSTAYRLLRRNLRLSLLALLLVPAAAIPQSLSGPSIAAKQTTDGPSLAETIGYINSHTSSGDQVFKANSLRVSVASSPDLLIIDVTTSELSESTSIPFGVLSKLKISAIDLSDGSGRIRLECPDGACMHRRTINPHTHNKDFRDRQEEWGIVDIAFYSEPEQGKRLLNASTHLLALLNQQYVMHNQQQDANDPFK